VDDHLDTTSRERAELVKVTKAVDEVRGPGISAARRLPGFGEPERQAGRIAIAQCGVESFVVLRARKPLV